MDHIAQLAVCMALLLCGDSASAVDGVPSTGAPAMAQSAETAEQDRGAGYPSDRGKTYQLEDIVVTATRNAAPARDVAADITVIERKEMEVLQYIPGVYVEFAGGSALRTRPGFRSF